MKAADLTILDIYKRIPLLRTNINENSAVESSLSIASALKKSTLKPTLVKKSLNIPIGDVTIDTEYNKEIPPTYRIPSVYVKHSKKIGDEADPSLDYIADHEDELWIKSISTQGIPKDIQKLLTISAFETIINILERYTGLSKDPIPQFNAIKVILDELQWSNNENITLINKLISIVYNYWLTKRLVLGKPLCRKYWPQITSSDTNPRQVFRARDKERYKLRKQQKRNDIEAFRKMQQLRKEFTTARNLQRLILEREYLREAEFDIQREVFEQRAFEAGIPYTPPPAPPVSVTHTTAATTAGGGAEERDGIAVLFNSNTENGIAGIANVDGSIYTHSSNSNSNNVNTSLEMTAAGLDIDSTTATTCSIGEVAGAEGTVTATTVKQRRVVPFRYSLHFPDLIYPPSERIQRDAEEKEGTENDGDTGIGATDAGAGDHTVVPATTGPKSRDRKRKRDRDRVAADSQAQDAAAMIVYAYDSNGQLVPSTAPAPAPASRAPTGRSTARGGSSSSRSSGGIAAAASSQSSMIYDPNLSSAELYSMLLADSQLNTAVEEITAVGPTVELRALSSTLGGPDSICQPAWPNFMSSQAHVQQTQGFSAAEYMRALEYRSDRGSSTRGVEQQHVLPVRYSARCRIGRGGRLVVDRFPVYDEENESEDEITERDCFHTSISTANKKTAAIHIYPTSLPYQYPENAYNLLFPPSTSLPPPSKAASSSSAEGTSIANDSSSQQIGDGNSAMMVDDAPTVPQQLLPELPLSNARYFFTALRNRNNQQQQSSSSNQQQTHSSNVSSLDASSMGPSSYNTNMTAQQRVRLSRMPKLPPFVSGTRPIIPAYKAARLAAILAASDSEEEKVNIPKYRRGEDVERLVSTKSGTVVMNAVDPSKVKYTTLLR